MVPPASATLLLDDRFDDGGITDGADPLDTDWWSVNASSSGGPWQRTTGNPSPMDVSALGHGAFSQKTSYAVGDFAGGSSFTFRDPGDILTVSMDLADNNDAANSADDSLPFLLQMANNGGTPMTGDELGAFDRSADDATIDLLRVPNDTDKLDDGDVHRLVLTLTLNAAGDLDRVVSIDGLDDPALSGTVDLDSPDTNSGLGTDLGLGSVGTVNQIRIQWNNFVNGEVKPRIDNVLVGGLNVVIPEPATWLLSTILLALHGRWARQR